MEAVKAGDLVMRLHIRLFVPEDAKESLLIKEMLVCSACLLFYRYLGDVKCPVAVVLSFLSISLTSPSSGSLLGRTRGFDCLYRSAWVA